MSDKVPHLRAALPHEAVLLTDLVLRAKAHWGYDEAFMAACRAELTLQPVHIETGYVWVAEQGGRLAGVLEIAPGVPQACLEKMFVEPAFIGFGIGKHLWEKGEGLARDAGASELALDSDPYAEGFYLAMGAVRVGEAPSGSIPGRVLPRMVKRLA